MTTEKSLPQRLHTLYEEQRLAVLATVSTKGRPYTSLMLFTIDEELRTLFFATRADTRKYRNLQHAADVALLVDNRQKQEDDLENALAVTIEGQVYEVEEAPRPDVRGRLILRFPQMESFFNDPETCFFCVEIERHIAVTGIGGVEVLKIRDSDRMKREGPRA